MICSIFHHKFVSYQGKASYFSTYPVALKTQLRFRKSKQIALQTYFAITLKPLKILIVKLHIKYINCTK